MNTTNRTLSRLGPTQFTIATTLTRNSPRTGSGISNPTLVELTGLSYNAVQKATKRLLSSGVAVKKSYGIRLRSNFYVAIANGFTKGADSVSVS